MSLRYFPVFILSIVATTAPAHADGSIFNSIGNAFSKVSKQVQTAINHYYDDGSEIDDGSSQPAASASPSSITLDTPIATPSPSGPSLGQCQKFLGLLYDTSSVSDPKQIATIYLNAVLDFSQTDPDTKPSAEEIAQRNICVNLALDAGADPNSNGTFNSSPGDNQVLGPDPVPLVRAVNDNDEVAVNALLNHKADPNALDTSVGRSLPLLKSSISRASQEISVDLINAGADLTVPDLLWVASSNAADKVVDVLIQSKKIPVNQITRFSDLSDDPGETAMDVSERAVAALQSYLSKYPVGSTASIQNKISDLNRILYYVYPLMPRLTNSQDPDAFMNQLLQRQQNVSHLLKAAGWSCKQDDCGVVDLGMT